MHIMLERLVFVMLPINIELNSKNKNLFKYTFTVKTENGESILHNALEVVIMRSKTPFTGYNVTAPKPPGPTDTMRLLLIYPSVNTHPMPVTVMRVAFVLV